MLTLKQYSALRRYLGVPLLPHTGSSLWYRVADSENNSLSIPVMSPRVRTITFIPSTCCIYFISFGQYWTSFCMANSSRLCSLSCSFCSSGRDFAAGFLQIRSHPRHPCLWLMIPTAKFIADLHRQVIAHAGHTTIKNGSGLFHPRFLFFSPALLEREILNCCR